MGTTVKEILDLMLALIPKEFKSDIAEDYELAERGLIEMGVALGQEFTFEGEGADRHIDVTLTMAEKWLASHFAYRCYLLRLKDELNQNAVNFSTITFSVKGLEKRPEAINDTLYQLNRYLDDAITRAKDGNCLIGYITKF